MDIRRLIGRILRMTCVGTCLLGVASMGPALAGTAKGVTHSEPTKATASIATGTFSMRATRLSADSIRVTVALHAHVRAAIGVNLTINDCHRLLHTPGHPATCPVALGTTSRVVQAQAGAAGVGPITVVMHNDPELECVHAEITTAQTLPRYLTPNVGPLVCLK
jgi:hypothetical protein